MKRPTSDVPRRATGRECTCPSGWHTQICQNKKASGFDRENDFDNDDDAVLFHLLSDDEDPALSLFDQLPSE
jgi:hypothetical protein